MNTECEKVSLRLAGGLLIVLSVCTFGLGIADIVVTWITCDEDGNCKPLTNSLLLAWIGVGVWASIPIFLTGVVTLWVSTHISTDRGWLTLLSFLSFFLFAPGIIVISILEIYYTYPDGLPEAPALDEPRFGIPLALAVGGAIIFLIAFIILVYGFCYVCQRETQEDIVPLERPPTIDTVNTAIHVNHYPQHQQQQPAHSQKMWSAYRWVNDDIVGGQERIARPIKPQAVNYYSAGAPPTRSGNVGAAGLYAGVSSGGEYFQVPRGTQASW
jgi:hypothetical protein